MCWKVNRVLSFNEEAAETEKDQDTHISNLDEKMADLMSLLLSSRGETDRTNRNDEFSSM